VAAILFFFLKTAVHTGRSERLACA